MPRRGTADGRIDTLRNRHHNGAPARNRPRGAIVTRALATLLVALLVTSPALATAAALPDSAAAPFPIVPTPTFAHPPHRAAWACLAGGAGLVAASFSIHDRANRRYDEYLSSSDPDRLARLYDQTITLDRISSATLLTGELVFVTGVYLRFLRGPGSRRLSLALEGGECVARWRF
jgi:hypothetical protein